ncbi:DUF3848 domain-containing protein [Faecalicatena contorta]|uniref:DUF3848 domain-containing protein n=1 Tax=Faecalicatena contorta TaxID=39482 RepID=UPI001F3DD266|nr:DUF3848 domain-containing protein [Faecalicatena contorta]MCF2554384.1 DUF3848 domain-containing protein [Faecalicatena contorta]
MGREKLQGLFCARLSLEYACFREKILQKSPEEIFQSAYEIDSIINIYEYLLEVSQELEEKVLEYWMLFPDILTFLYQRWLKQEDSYIEELSLCMRKELTRCENDKGEERQVA